MNLLAIFPLLQTQPDPEATIRAEDLRAHVYFLASEELEGREAGSAGERFASRYLAEQLASYGLEGAGPEGSFFQEFEALGRKMRNVTAVLEGADPELRRQFVALGAHFDHIGWGGHGSLAREKELHNGADDNGSGTASLLELAQAFALARPKRSLLFLHFSGEEEGLLGSAHYCEEPQRPLEETVAMLNLDMVGRSEAGYLFVGGVGTGEGLSDLVAEKSRGLGFRLETASGGAAPSDNTNFFKEEVPVLFFFTQVHEDYHAAGDDWWKVEYEGQERITRLVYRITRTLAEEPQRREFFNDGGIALPRDHGERMGKIRKRLVEAEKKKGGKKASK